MKERYKTYYRLIPSWTALRYDRKPFQIWEFLFPFLRDKLTNPFYYTDLPEWEEIPKINKILLEKIRKEYDKKILLFLSLQKTDYQSIKNKYNLNQIPLIKTRFHYMYYHESSLGNEYIAKFYFKALLGEKNFSLNRIQCFFSQNTDSRSKLSKIDLSLVNNIQILERDNLLSVLNKNSPDKDNSYKKNKVKDTKHFISFSSSDNFFENPFFPINFPLKEPQKLYLKLDSKNIIELGEIKALDSHHNFFVFYADYINFIFGYNYNYISYFKVKNLPPKLKELLKNRRKPIDLLIGKHKMGTLYPGLRKGEKIFSFFSKKQHKHSFLMMGPSSGLVREKNFKEEFSPEMLYTMEDGAKIKSPIPYSLYFKNCEGVVPLSSFKKDFIKVKIDTYWKITAESLIFHQKKKVKAILINDLCEKNCKSSLFQHPFMDCSSYCQSLSFDFPTVLSGESLKDYSFFNFQPLIKNFESQKSSCEKLKQ